MKTETLKLANELQEELEKLTELKMNYDAPSEKFFLIQFHVGQRYLYIPASLNEDLVMWIKEKVDSRIEELNKIFETL